ncbi:hypothetical protein Bca4012_052241 [Brassica carinata]
MDPLPIRTRYFGPGKCKLSFAGNLKTFFYVDHFIGYLTDDVQIVRDIPDWFTEHLLTELFFFFCRRRVKSIPKYAAAQFYVDKCFANDKGKEYSGIKAFVRLTWVYPLSLGLRLLEIFLFTDE